MKNLQLLEKIAHKLVNYSCGLQKGNNVYIEIIDGDNDFLDLLLCEISKVGATAFVGLKSESLIRKLNSFYEKSDFEIIANAELSFLKEMDAFIGIRYPKNIYEFSGINPKKNKLMRKHYLQPVHYNYRNNNLKWVFWRYPTPAMAQQAKKNNDDFYKEYLKATLFDFEKYKDEINYLSNILKNTSKIKIIAENGTNIIFYKKNIDVFKSLGKHNLPDGEIFTAPVKNSINGKLVVNTPSIYHGSFFDKIELFFKEGKIDKFNTNDDESFSKIIEQDSGSKFIGEFAIGFNKNVMFPINDILYDEKMVGSVHFAIGNSYKETDNGNKSSVHWDLILDFKKINNSSVYFDDKIIMKNGKFVLPLIENLNL